MSVIKKSRQLNATTVMPSSKMRGVTATFKIEEDSGVMVTEILRQFPMGIQVQLAISEVPPPDPVPDLEAYRQSVAAARKQLPPIPWRTTAEVMQALREGEEE